MRLILPVLALALSASTFASENLLRAPKSFPYGGGKAVYVDFTKAVYEVTYDVAAKSATVQAIINFRAAEAGNPIYDLVNDPSALELDGVRIADAKIGTPDGATNVRVLQAAVTPGEHVLRVSAPLTELVEWEAKGVRSAFWTTDLEDRGYLEQYLPANMEFDQVPMELRLVFKGADEQVIYTNGQISETNGQQVVTFPKHFTASSVFFHTVPKGTMIETRFTYRSVDGRELPVTIYRKPPMWGGDPLQSLKKQTEQVLAELEGDYGPFLHSSVTIYNAGSGGMEYCGATMTSVSALGHELTHSYFARGIMPAEGNSGWIDEALASWRDNHYPRATSLSGSANMAGRASYTRYTDMAAYSFGARFMSYLDGKFASQGGLKPLLRKLVAEKAFTPYNTDDFVEWASGHFREDLAAEFKRYVYSNKWYAPEESDHSFHKKMTIEEMRSHL